MGLRTYDADGNATVASTTTPTVQQCADAAANLTAHKATYNATLIKYLVVQRLGNLRDTGKFGVRYSVQDTLRSFMSSKYPELVSGVFVEPRGADAHAPAAATVSALMNLYVESDEYLVAGAPAHLALYRRRLSQVGASHITLLCTYVCRSCTVMVRMPETLGEGSCHPCWLLRLYQRPAG
jgi:hypothetical protein